MRTSVLSMGTSSSGLSEYRNVVETCMAGATARWELTLSSAWTDSDASESSAAFLFSEPAMVKEERATRVWWWEFPVAGFSRD